MMSIHTFSHQEQLEHVLAEYLEAVDAGVPLCREDLVDRHPEIAGELLEFFAAQDEINQAAADHDEDCALWIDCLRDLEGKRAAHDGARTKVGFFGDYELLGEIAHGGMGVVYKARQAHLERVVALKMLLRGHVASSRDIRRFRQEAEAAASLQHQNIVPIYEVGFHDGQHYFSMGYVDGPSLAAVVKEGPVAAMEAAAIVEQVASAVAYAHDSGVIHRDLKPANILLDRVSAAASQNSSHAIKLSLSSCHSEGAGQFIPMVTDFGLAKIVQASNELTGTGEIIGTPSYIPPEQAAGHVDRLGPSVDIYSLGAVLYCLLTGRPPFRAATVMETLVQVVDNEPTLPSLLNSQVPRDLETICLKCLQKDRRNRYRSAQDLVDDLRRFQNGEPIEARPVHSLERAWRWCRRNPVVSSLVSAVVLLLLLGSIVSTSFAIHADQNATIARQLASDKETLALVAELQAAEAADSERLRSKELYVARMNLVQRAWEQENTPRMLQLLNSLAPTSKDDPDLRGFEWRYWWNVLHSDERTINAVRVHSIDCSPDGRTVAVGGQGLSLRDLDSGRLLHDLDARLCPSTAMSPDGRHVAACFDRQVMVFEVESGQAVHVLDGHDEEVRCVAYHPDGNRLVSGGGDAVGTEDAGSGELFVWDLITGARLATVQNLPTAIVSLAFNTDGDLLAAGDRRGFISLWDPSNWVQSKTWRAGSDNSPISGLSFSLDGKRVVSSGWNLRVWDVATTKQMGALTSRGGQVRDAEVHPDGRHVVGGLESGTVCMWDLTSQELVRQWQGHSSRITSISIGPQGNRVVSAEIGTGVKVWNLSTNPERQVLSVQPKYISQIEFSPDSQWMACAEGTSRRPDRRGVVQLWNVASNARGPVLAGHQCGVFGVSFNPVDGRTLATASADGSVLLWDLEYGTLIDEFVRQESPFFGIDYHPDGKRLATCDDDGCIKVWNCQTRAVEMEFAVTGQPARNVRFSPCGRQLAVSHKRRLIVWELQGGDIVLDEPMKSCQSLAFGSNSQTIASTDGRELSMWELRSSEEQFHLSAHNRYCKSVAVSPDGRSVATGGLDNTLKLWSTETGEQLLVLSNVGALTAIAFSPDGSRLAASGEGHQVILFNSVAP